jgi:sterol 3beta-glucosyltransferase
METLGGMLDRLLTPEDGGNSDAGKTLIRQLGVLAQQQFEWNAALAFQPDLILYHPKCLGSFHIAEKLNLPLMMAIPLPLYTPTTAFPVPFFANLKLGGRVNLLTYRFA